MKKDKRGKICILQVNKLYYPASGGIERVVQQLAEGLSGETDTKVLVCQEKGKTVKEYVNGVEVHRASSLGVVSSLPVSLSFLWKFSKMSKDRDIVHIHLPFPLGDLACFLSGYRGKVVLWWHSDIVRQKKMMKLYRPLMEWLLRRADAIIVATEGHIEGSLYLKAFADKCVVIPFGVDRYIEEKADLWIQSEKESKGKSKKERAVRFLFVGRFVYYKGCRVLLKAFAGAVEKNPGIHLDLVGSGPMQKELEELVKEYNLQGKVEFHSNVNDEELIEYFQRCDVFVLPSIARSEAFGLVQIEAMSFGKPVINTRLASGVPYVSLDQVTGVTVEPENVQELAEAIIYMAEHPQEREQMGMRARERMKELYRIETMLENVKKLYENLTEGNG